MKTKAKALIPEHLRKPDAWGGFKPGDGIEATAKSVGLVLEKEQLAAPVAPESEEGGKEHKSRKDSSTADER